MSLVTFGQKNTCGHGCSLQSSGPSKLLCLHQVTQRVAQSQRQIPSNFYLTASKGGNLDAIINKNPDVFIRTSQVVYTEQEAADLG